MKISVFDKDGKSEGVAEIEGMSKIEVFSVLVLAGLATSNLSGSAAEHGVWAAKAVKSMIKELEK